MDLRNGEHRSLLGEGKERPGSPSTAFLELFPGMFVHGQKPLSGTNSTLRAAGELFLVPLLDTNA
jgi:hypothetical protein